MPEPHTLMTGLVSGESPRWHDGRLWLSDFGTREVIAVNPEGRGEVIARVPGMPMGRRRDRPRQPAGQRR